MLHYISPQFLTTPHYENKTKQMFRKDRQATKCPILFCILYKIKLNIQFALKTTA